MNTKVMKENLRKRNKRIKVRKAIVNLSMTIIVISIFVLMFISWLQGTVSVSYDGDFSTYIVADGDRLWDIAEQCVNGKDIRDVIYIIKKDNNMSTSSLSIGQELQIRNQY